MNEQIIKDIDTAIMKNRVMRRSYDDEFHKDYFRENNDLLGRVRTILKSRKGYERGANDAWELAKKIALYKDDHGYGSKELTEIFGTSAAYHIIKDHSYQEALAKVKEYEKKKEEEAAKPKLGDVVKPVSIAEPSIPYPTGIFLGKNKAEVYVMEKNTPTPARYLGNNFRFIKTGEHVDIQGILDRIG